MSSTRNTEILESGPDETASIASWRYSSGTDEQWEAGVLKTDDPRVRGSRDGSAKRTPMPGLAGRLSLTRRHGLVQQLPSIPSYFHSMFNQHAKWLKVTVDLAWRRKTRRSTSCSHRMSGDRTIIASRIRIRFHRRRQNKKAAIVRVYLPPDANCLLSVMDHCLRSRQYVNVVVAETSRAALAADGRRSRASHERRSASGMGEQR